MGGVMEVHNVITPIHYIHALEPKHVIPFACVAAMLNQSQLKGHSRH